MAAYRRTPSARAVMQRRKRIWARRNFSDASLATTPESFDLLSDFTGELGVTAIPPGMTIGGILLDYQFRQETEASAANTDALFMGIRVSQEATLSEIDSPLAEQHHDWMWYQMFNGSATGATDKLTHSSSSDLGGPLRIRSKRRIDEVGMRLTITFVAVGASTYSTRISSSVLLLMA